MRILSIDDTNMAKRLVCSLDHARYSSPMNDYKRQKTEFMWRRLQKPSLRFKPLAVKETPDLIVLKMMLDMNRDDPAVARNLDRMQTYHDHMMRSGGSRVVRYEQATLGGNVDDIGYEGDTAVGRAFTSSPLNQLPRRVLNTMFKRTHVEIDLKASYPTMLAKVFEGAELTALKVYANDSKGVFDGFESQGVRRELVKQMVMTTICSFPSKPVSFGIDLDEVEACRVFDGHPFVESLRADLGRMSKYMKEHYKEFYGMVSEHCRAKGKSGTEDGTAFSYIAGDVEHSVMRCVIDKVYGDKIEDMVWLYDGIIVRQSVMDDQQREEFCASLSRHVRDKLGLDVSFGIKDLQSNSLPISISNQEMRELTGYAAWKREFERKWFRLTNPPVYCMILPDGTVLDHTDVAFKHNTMEENSDMIKMWKADPGKRAYLCKDFAPFPCVPIKNSYNTWPGFAAEKIVDVPVDYDLGPYLRHVKLLMGNKDEYADYFNKLMALKIQQPGSLWRVMPFIRSTPGVGKDLWFDFIMRIMGPALTCKVPKVGDVMEKSTHLIESKVLICFNEVEFNDSSRYMDVLKDAITSDRITVKKKYVNDYTLRSCASIMAFSNNFGAFSIPVDDRRFFPVTADGALANNKEYFDVLRPYLDKEETVAAVYQYYKTLDINDFDPSGHRPITDTFKEMSISNISLFDTLLKKGFHLWLERARSLGSQADMRIENEVVLKVPVNMIWDDFQQVAMEAKINKSDSRNAMIHFGSRLMSEAIERIQRFKSLETWDKAIVSYTSHGKRYKRFDIVAVQRYITEMLDGQDDDEEAMLIPPQA